ncbi:MAG: reprolysin-like metallopeptidase, partial [Nonlabens sp.]
MNKFTIFCFAIVLSLGASAQTPWSKSSMDKINDQNARIMKATPTNYGVFDLDLSGMRSILASAGERHIQGSIPAVVEVPTLDGMLRFSVFENSVMEGPLQDRYQNIRTYNGVAVDDSGRSIQITVSPYSFHGLVHTPGNGLQYIDPLDKAGSTYMVYSSKELPAIEGRSICTIEESTAGNRAVVMGVDDANDEILRTYRIAISATVEYSSFQWQQAGFTAASPVDQRRSAVLAAMAVTLARVNSIYERDLAIEMDLVANNDQLVFITSDNLANSSPNVILGQNQALIDNVIGSANYDIGHVFTTGGGGLASLGSVCNSNRKAQGVTGSPAPVGDPYDIDFVAHELGHQFGARHTFNGSAGNCQGGNRSASNSYEVGSGTTIMAYAGICPPQNVQPNSDAYFHQASINEIINYVRSGGFCSTNLPIANDAPTVGVGTPILGIPASTPYKLTGSSTDPQGTALHTYTWEQYDLGTVAGLPAPTNTTGPLVRSREGTLSPVRYVPQLSDVIVNGGTSTEWEVLASVSRVMNYRLTVRDNDARGGQTESAEKRIFVQGAAGPFVVTSQDVPNIVWAPGTQELVTWNVAGTDGNGINSSFVNILLSTDAGETFDTVLASNVPNDGSEMITVPSGIVAPFSRLMVESADNIFFNVNSTPFSVNAVLTTVCNTYSSGPVNAAIPDNGGGANLIRNNIVVNDMMTYDTVEITADVTHTWIS